MLRARQFSEDSGPRAHCIRPESYMKMDNFYTATVRVSSVCLCLFFLFNVHVAVNQARKCTTKTKPWYRP